MASRRVVSLAGAHGGDQLDGLADVAQRLATARFVEHAVDGWSQRGRVPGQQDLAADGLAETRAARLTAAPK